MPEREGTGRHPHKKTEEPWPHAKEEGKQQGGKAEAEQSGPAGAARAREQEKGGGRQQLKGESREARQDLKEREYRDEAGNIHHHTRTFMEQHKGEKEKE
jgi:hypothetical protein